MNILSIKDFFLFYGKKAILKNINLELKKNKIIAIIGPSGCGKSTLLKSINGIVFEENSVITSGEILFEKEEDRKKVGLIFQNPTPFPVSIYKNLVYAPIYYGIKKKAELICTQFPGHIKIRIKNSWMFPCILQETSILFFSGFVYYYSNLYIL